MYDAHAYRQYFEHDFTYLNGFRRNVHRYAQHPAIEDPATGTTVTYAELGDRVDRLATGLADAGVETGDVVAYQLFNGVEFAELYLATQAAGAVGSPMNFRLAAGETSYILASNRPRVFVYDTDLTPMVRDALERSEFRPGLLVAVGPGEPLPGAVRFDDLVAATARALQPDRTVWDETTRLYTSGTTGMPKGVPLNSLVEIFSAHDVIMHFPMSPEDKTLNMTPWFHRGGLYCAGPNPTFYLGSSLVPMRAFDADTTLDHVQRYGLTFLIGAPTNLAMLAHAQEARRRDLSSLRGIVTMGAPLEREAALRYQKVLNPNIFNGYGSTEGFWNTFLRPSDLPAMAGTAGRACIDDDVAVVRVLDDRLAEPEETVAKDGTEVGEVIVRSPKGANAYVDSPDQEARKFHRGWLYIGDLATWDEEEFVTIVGRKDDMLLSGGENVHPVQVEEALNEHPGVDDCLVVGIPDERWGQVVVAYVVAAEPGVGVAELDRHCRTHPMLSAFKRPRAYRFVDSLPVSATGKKLHYKLTEQARDDAAAGLFTYPDKEDA
ncbi:MULTISPECIES: class I adenylate-forming enzyme family protein [Nocardia]|uniref:class I adenylate-forming enzyme family protein n=1 Tax=Nocardia TaxID=1817 RepID=UPI0007E98A07|nr:MULTISPECIES: AMP-binding protein [Nocardia]MBF6272183.1 AMP-binding protein [Nocardia nova]OBA46214.1 AMP-dependent synthetase [Nocardia sp. 852002-51101_SCH5132738]OBB44772.1 AMP-dependent synthetase [Nocardia sp. 852002-51244_SCH5132740]OBF69862.1 AMP-dependent synthetase [Mycobacterium sp. 852002-51759_SCH5129042]